MCLIKDAFVGEKNFERYQNARYNNKNLRKAINLQHKFGIILNFSARSRIVLCKHQFYCSSSGYLPVDTSYIHSL